MARWVLPVLVGPSTAVTPAPRVRDARAGCGEKLIAITRPDWWQACEQAAASTRFPVSQCDDEHAAWLSFRTSLERIAPESLTPALYGFVHGDIWRAPAAQPQDGVAQARFKRDLVPSNVNASLDSTRRPNESSAISRHCVFDPLAEARAGSGTETNSDASSTAWPIGVGPCARYGTRHAGAGDRREPDLHVALLGEVLDRRARRDDSPPPARNTTAQTTTGPA